MHVQKYYAALFLHWDSLQTLQVFLDWAIPRSNKIHKSLYQTLALVHCSLEDWAIKLSCYIVVWLPLKLDHRYLQGSTWGLDGGICCSKTCIQYIYCIIGAFSDAFTAHIRCTNVPPHHQRGKLLTKALITNWVAPPLFSMNDQNQYFSQISNRFMRERDSVPFCLNSF